MADNFKSDLEMDRQELERQGVDPEYNDRDDSLTGEPTSGKDLGKSLGKATFAGLALIARKLGFDYYPTEDTERALGKRFGFDEGGDTYGMAAQMDDLVFRSPDVEIDPEELRQASIDTERKVMTEITDPDFSGFGYQNLDVSAPTNLATPPLSKAKSPYSRRPGFRGDGPFDFKGFGSYLKENVSKEELTEGLDFAGQWMVPFYEAGSNLTNVVAEYNKPEDERDYDYIKEELGKAGNSAATEAAMWLMGGIAVKYGGKGIKAIADKVKQYEIDPNTTSAFGVGAIKKKASEPLEIGVNAALEDGKFLKNYDASTASDMAEKAKNATAGNARANALMNAAVPEGTKVGIRLNLNSTIPNMPKGLDKLQTLHKGSFSGKAMSYLPFATVKNVTFNVSQKGRTAIASRIKQIDTPEAKAKYPAMSVDGDYVPDKNLLDEGGDLVEIGLNPGAHHLFIDLKTGQAVKGAEEATVIGDRVYAKGVEYWKKAEAPVPIPTQSGVDIPSDVRFRFKKGGLAMNDQMNNAFALGGEVNAIDPVSGNEVPPGSTPKEVRDDIPAMLSEGEYVVPADVARYYGIKFFEDLRNNAKIEMAEMQANGRIGGQPVPEGDDLTEDEMRLLDEVMGMAEGGLMDPYQQQATMYNNPQMMQPMQPQADPMMGMAEGGDIYGLQGGGNQDDPTTGIAIDPVDTGTDDGSSGVMETKYYIHKDKRRISVLMLNNKPISGVPADFDQFLEDTPANRKKLGWGTEGDGTEGTTDDTTTTNNNDNDVYSSGTQAQAAKVKDDSPEGLDNRWKDSGVSTQDPLKAAKEALDKSVQLPSVAGMVAGAINPFLGVAVGAGQAASQLDAVSVAQANKRMAEFLGKDDEAAAIDKAINDFVAKAPKVVGALDEKLASGDKRFEEALKVATNIDAPDDAVIYTDTLTDKGKANLDEYMAEYRNSTRTGTVRPMLRPPMSPGMTTQEFFGEPSVEAEPERRTRTDNPKVTLGRTLTTGTIGNNTTGTNSAAQNLANSLTPNDGKVYVDGVLREQVVEKYSAQEVKQAEDNASSATNAWVAATNAANSVSPDDPAAWTAAIRAQSEASRAATRAIQERTQARNNDDDPSNDSPGGCFLTTAIVDRRGEADDGPTLTKLRNFRDTYMAAIPSDVEEYYRVAPQIVASIPADHKDWDWIGSQVDKSVEYIDRNLLDKAYKTYKDMVKKLEKDWL